MQYTDKDLESFLRYHQEYRINYLDNDIKTVNHKLTTKYGIKLYPHEIEAEIIHQMMILSKSFDGKRDNYLGYAKQYVILRTVQAITREHINISRCNIDDMYNADDNNEIKHQVLKYENEYNRTLSQKKMIADDILSIVDMMDDMDKKIAHMIIDGLTQDEISDKLGISQQAISKRLTKMQKYFIK